MLAACTVICGGTVSAQRKLPPHRPVAPAARTAAADGCVSKFTAGNWATMLADIRVSKPDIVKQLESDPEFRSKQVSNLRELFALGCEAVKEGVSKDPVIRGELDNIRAEVSASEYERSTVKPPPAEALSSVTDARVATFYKTAGNEARFDNFLKVKLELLGRVNPGEIGKKVTDDERAQAKAAFARISLLAADSTRPAAKANAALRDRIELQVKLQQAQFLARQLTDGFADKFRATDAEIDKYIAAHPELSTAAIKAKADGILKRALAGEDFAKLANEYSEDPGNMSEDGKPQGGLYSDVPNGKMVPEFEKTALGLEAGKVSPVLTQSDYGFHIIKLDRKGEKNGAFSYDVRHILILTQFQDPEDPNSPPIPAAELARRTIERQRADELKAKIVKENPVEMAEIPTGAPAPAEKATPAKTPVRK